MDAVISVLAVADIFLAILLVVVSMAQMDRRYASKVRVEHERKSILRGHDRNDR